MRLLLLLLPHLFLDVRPRKPRDGDELDLLLDGVAALLPQERPDLGDALVEPFFGPLDGRVVHLVDHHHKVPGVGKLTQDKRFRAKTNRCGNNLEPGTLP